MEIFGKSERVIALAGGYYLIKKHRLAAGD